MSLASNYPSTLPSLSLDFANTKKLDPRITFTRATTATYYDGRTTTKAEENLLLRSQEFDNASWNKAAVSISANSTTAPDGTSTADSANSTSTDPADGHYLYQNVGTLPSSIQYVYSVYVKQNTYTRAHVKIQKGCTSSEIYGVLVNLTNGTAAETNGTWSGATNSIQDAGNGWYRVSIFFAGLGSGNHYCFVTPSASSVTYSTCGDPKYLGDGSGIYIWGAQLEQRSSVTAYTATTSAPITNYIPTLQTAAAGQARFDHNPTTGESLGLLIEEQRTNLLTYSADFSNAIWLNSKASISSNVIIAPDGTLTGDKLVEDSTTGAHQTNYNGTTTNGITYTSSFFAKAAERSWISFYTSAASSGLGRFAYFNLATGVLGTVASEFTATITPVGNGWYRCTVKFTANSANELCTLIMATADQTYNYAGNGYYGVYIWGAQTEVGSFATSYIPTTSAAVTRNEDYAYMNGINFTPWFNYTEGSFYAEANSIKSSASTNPRLIGADGAYEFLGLSSTSTSEFNLSGVASNKTGTSNNVTSYIKSAMGYSSSGVSITRENLSPATSTYNLSLTYIITGITLGYGGGNLLNGTIKKVSYYPIRLTNAQLQALTS